MKSRFVRLLAPLPLLSMALAILPEGQNNPVMVNAVDSESFSGIHHVGVYDDGMYGNTIGRITDLGDMPDTDEEYTFTLIFNNTDANVSAYILNSLTFRQIRFQNAQGAWRYRWIAYSIDSRFVDGYQGELLSAFGNSCWGYFGSTVSPVSDEEVTYTYYPLFHEPVTYCALTWDYTPQTSNDLLDFVFVYPFTLRSSNYLPEILSCDMFQSAGWINQGEINKAYNEGREKGQQEGRAKGYEEGKQAGIEIGTSQVTSGGFIGGLFIAIAEVPITILNGIGAFSVFNVSIMTILLVFLFMGVIIWLIKRFI